MAASVKLDSVYGNNLKAGYGFTPQSFVYAEATDAVGNLEDCNISYESNYSISTLHWGSTGVVDIPPVQRFLGGVFLFVTVNFPVPTVPFVEHVDADGTTIRNVQVDYSYLITRLMDSFTYKIGSSDTVTVKSNMIPVILNEYCGSQEQRETIADVAGCTEFRDGQSYLVANRFQPEDKLLNLGIMLPLPCSLPDKKKVKPLPLYMLPNGTSLRLEFKWRGLEQVKNLIYNAGVGDLSRPVIKSATVKCIHYKTAENSILKTTLYRYPYDHFQFHDFETSMRYENTDASQVVFDNFIAQTPNDVTGRVLGNVTVSGLAAGETTQLLFYIAKSSEKEVEGANSISFDPLIGLKLKNISVRFGSQLIWETDTPESHRIVDMHLSKKPSSLPGPKKPVQSLNIVTHWDRVDYSQAVRNRDVVWSRDPERSFYYRIPLGVDLASNKRQFDYLMGTDFGHSTFTIQYEVDMDYYYRKFASSSYVPNSHVVGSVYPLYAQMHVPIPPSILTRTYTGHRMVCALVQNTIMQFDGNKLSVVK